VPLFLLAGIAPSQVIKIDSDPPGAHVFVTMGGNEELAKSGHNYIGTTPCEWTAQMDGDGTFHNQQGGIPFYSSFVQWVVVFTAEPPSGHTNLFTRREVFHGRAHYQPGTKVPDGIFFDLTKPN